MTTYGMTGSYGPTTYNYGPTGSYGMTGSYGPTTYNYGPTGSYGPTTYYNPPTYNYGPTGPNYYFQPPPFIETTLRYQNVNADPGLQKKVTTYFLNKTIKWIKKDKSFKSCKKYLKKLDDEEDGYKIMHKLLKILVKKGNTNWYDLRPQEETVKEYILHKLTNL